MPIIILLALMLTGCINISTQTQPSNPAVQPLLQGQDCVTALFGIGAGSNSYEAALAKGLRPDVRSSYKSLPVQYVKITRVRSTSLTEANHLFILNVRCLEVVGEP